MWLFQWLSSHPGQLSLPYFPNVKLGQQPSTALMRQATLQTKLFRSVPVCFGTSGQISWNALCLQLIETLHFWNSSFIYALISSEICRYESMLKDSNTQYFSLSCTVTACLKWAASTAKTITQRNHPTCFLAFGKLSKSKAFEEIFDTLAN